MLELFGNLKTVVERNRGRLVVAVVLIVGMYFVVAFGEQAWKARTLQAEVAGREDAIATMQAKHDTLQRQLARYQSDQYNEYVERIARRDLSLAHPGETVILTHQLPAPTPIPSPTSGPADQRVDQRNLDSWLDLFGLR